MSESAGSWNQNQRRDIDSFVFWTLLGTDTIRVMPSPLGGLASRMSHALANYARQELEDAAATTKRYADAIRKHMNTRGDHRCFQDDHELYLELPEGDTRPAKEVAVTIENCQRYLECRQTGREYISPQVRIDELEAEVTKLKVQRDKLAHDLGEWLGRIQ